MPPCSTEDEPSPNTEANFNRLIVKKQKLMRKFFFLKCDLVIFFLSLGTIILSHCNLSPFIPIAAITLLQQRNHSTKTNSPSLTLRLLPHIRALTMRCCHTNAVVKFCPAWVCIPSWHILAVVWFGKCLGVMSYVWFVVKQPKCDKISRMAL